MTTGRVSKRHRKYVDDDVVVGDVGDVVAVVGVGDGVNPMRNGIRKSHKKFQLSKLRIVDRRSKLLEGTVCVVWGGVVWISRHSSVPAAFARMLRKLQQLQKLQQMRWDNQ